MERHVGALLVLVGIGIVVVGALIWTGGLGWFGRLPGDIRVEGERSRVFVPITSMVLVSVVLTVLLNLLLRWWR